MHTARTDHHLHHRIRSEYLEMPGLSLTAAQARRLFGADEHACVSLLEELVAAGFLQRRESRYVRATDVSRASMARRQAQFSSVA